MIWFGQDNPWSFFTVITTTMCVQETLQGNKQGLRLHHTRKHSCGVLPWSVLTTSSCPQICRDRTEAWMGVPGERDGIQLPKSYVSNLTRLQKGPSIPCLFMSVAFLLGVIEQPCIPLFLQKASEATELFTPALWSQESGIPLSRQLQHTLRFTSVHWRWD